MAGTAVAGAVASRHTTPAGTTLTPVFTTNDTDSWLLVLALIHDGSTATPPDYSDSDGFGVPIVNILDGGTGSSVRLLAFLKKSTGAEADMTLTFAGDIGGVARGIVLDGLDGSTATDVIGTFTQGSAGSPVAPSEEAPNGDVLVLAIGGRDDNDPADAAPSQGTFLFTDTAESVGGNGMGLLVAHFVQASSGPTGATTLSIIGSSEAYAAGHIIFKTATGADVDAPTNTGGSLASGGTRGESLTVTGINDNQATTVTLKGVVIPAADTTPTAAQVSAGTDAADVALAAGLVDTASVTSLPNSGTLDFTGIPSDADQKFCYTVEDADGNRSTVQTVNIPAPGSSVGVSDLIIEQTTVAAVTDNNNFQLANHPARADSYNEFMIYLEKPGNAHDVSHGRITDIDASGNVVVTWLSVAPASVAVSDIIKLEPSNAEQQVKQLDTPDMSAELRALIVADLATSVEMQAARNEITSVANDLNDGVPLASDGVLGRVVTSAAGTPTNQVIELTSGVAYDGQYVDKYLEFTGGSVIGVPRKITASDASANTVTLEAPLPAVPAAADALIIV